MSLCSVVEAGKYNSTVNIGDKMPAWRDLPGVDDKTHSLSDLDKYAVVVVVFTCNSCPYAVDYENRINQLAEKYQGSDSPVAVVAINANKIEADQLPAMKKRASERKFVFPYLYDETQQVAKSFGAVRTPEFFVLNRERQLVYTGAMDDNTKEDQVKTNYLQAAIDATMKGEAVATTETPPVGCGIRYVKERRPQVTWICVVNFRSSHLSSIRIRIDERSIDSSTSW